MVESVHKVLRLQPDHVRAQIALARTLMSRGEVDEVRPLVEALSKTQNDLLDVLLLKGWLAEMDGRVEDALAAYQAALSEAPEKQILIRVFLAQLRLKRPREAVDTMKAWLNTHPDDAQVLSSLASTYLMLGETERARILF